MQFLPRYLERRYGGEAQTPCEWGYSLTFALHKCATLDPQLRLFLRLLDGTASDALFHDLCQMQAALHTACQQAEVGHLPSPLPSGPPQAACAPDAAGPSNRRLARTVGWLRVARAAELSPFAVHTNSSSNENSRSSTHERISLPQSTASTSFIHHGWRYTRSSAAPLSRRARRRGRRWDTCPACSPRRGCGRRWRSSSRSSRRRASAPSITC